LRPVSEPGHTFLHLTPRPQSMAESRATRLPNQPCTNTRAGPPNPSLQGVCAQMVEAAGSEPSAADLKTLVLAA